MTLPRRLVDPDPAGVEVRGRLTARGAARAAAGQPDDAEWVVLQDPEGNEFCLLEPR